MVGLSESDMERIRAFNEQPWYAKKPDLLRPDEDKDESTEADASD